MRSGTVQVTQEDINAGQAYDGSAINQNCAVARALSRELGERIECGYNEAFILSEDGIVYVTKITLQRTSAFIHKADNIRPSTVGLQPFSFTYTIED